MAYLVCEHTIKDGWLAALEYLLAQGADVFDLVVTIDRPADGTEGIPVERVNEVLSQRRLKRVQTVANTIFPAELAATSKTRQQLYERYCAMLPRLRRLDGNRRGTYFERLIDFPLQQDKGRANQIETVITDLQQQLMRRSPLRSVYEAQIFAPGKDRLPQGFPCMSSLSFQLDGPHLRLSATYRNQYYVQRALGNLIGLANLLEYVASETGLGSGPLTVHAFRAQIDPRARRQAAALAALLRELPKSQVS